MAEVMRAKFGATPPKIAVIFRFKFVLKTYQKLCYFGVNPPKNLKKRFCFYTISEQIHPLDV